MNEWVPALIVLAAFGVAIVIVRAVIDQRGRGTEAAHTVRFRRQAWTVGLIFLAILVAVFVLPDTVDSNLAFSVIGLVVTGALAISGQSIIANGMAGIMLRIIRNFRPGDFIEVGEHRGRVSEMGLFHTEIQSPDRDLITLPNMLMVAEPVRVVRSSGTIVSVQIGLGYDLSRHTLKPLFIAAAEEAELEDPFVQVIELGDYAVTYRIAGFLAESTRLLAARSRLREALLDTLSENDIEIMSPMFVARRSVTNEALLPVPARPLIEVDEGPTAEEKVFDKAELAAGAEGLRTQLAERAESIEKLEAVLAGQTGDEAERTRAALETEREAHERLTQQIVDAEEASEAQV